MKKQGSKTPQVDVYRDELALPHRMAGEFLLAVAGFGALLMAVTFIALGPFPPYSHLGFLALAMFLVGAKIQFDRARNIEDSNFAPSEENIAPIGRGCVD